MYTVIVACCDSRGILRKFGLAVLVFVVMVGLHSQAKAQATFATLAPSVASPQMLGTPMIWGAALHYAPSGHTYGYQFIVTYNGHSQIVRDFSPTASFVWVPHTVEGQYQVSVAVRDTTTSPYVYLPLVTANYTLQPWVTAPLAAVVNPTTHPLVALFSGPPCATGHQLLVRFRPANSQVSNITNFVPCSQNSANFLVAGMLPSTQYLMHWEEFGTNYANVGSDLSFTTGALPSAYPVPTFQVNVAATALDAAYPVVLFHLLALGSPDWPTATDLAGHVLWYAPGTMLMTRMEPGGIFFSITNTTLNEYDLAGNLVLETNSEILNEQLTAKGYPVMTGFNNHETRILPNGNILVLAGRDVVSTSAQGGTVAEPVDIIGDMVLILDHNMQLVWAWDSFAHEDITRAAILGDICTQGGAGCAPFNSSFAQANDWLHTNAAQMTADGNIILSHRSQDWIVKINYANGTGDGSVLWRMGPAGDFTIVNPPSTTCGTSTNVFPWFTHQHDTAFEFESDASGGGFKIMTVFDDGNTREAQCPAPQNSRGMVLFVGEAARQVYIETAADLGAYSQAVGAAQLLIPGDGNVYASYDNGFLPGKSQVTETDLAGNILYQLQVNDDSYRTYRMQNLYTPTLP
jgi:arylsulfate sulfotransferase